MQKSKERRTRPIPQQTLSSNFVNLRQEDL